MRLAISNIAWKPREAEAVLDVLAEIGAEGLEIAPALAFPDAPDPFEPSSRTVGEFHASLARRRLRVVSMQSLLFGVQGAALFGSAAERERFETGIARAIRLAGWVGVPNLVMGSPANRVIPEAMDRAAAEIEARETFRRLGDLCLANRTVLALEPNPRAYGTNFLTTIAEATAFAQIVDHPGITINFDLGSLHMNGEIDRVEPLFAAARDRTSHVHVSEPQLAPAPRDRELFRSAAAAILRQGYDRWFSIEMRAPSDDNIDAVRQALAACGAELAAADALARGGQG